MFGAVRLGIRAWEKGEEKSALTRRVRIIKSHIKRQVTSICTQNILNSKKAAKPVAFIVKGTNESIEFITDHSVSPGNEISPVFVKYYLSYGGTTDLVLYEKTIGTLSYEDLMNSENNGAEENSHVVLKDIDDVQFQYLKRNIDGSTEWQDFWDTGLKQVKNFPLAVKLTFIIDNSPIELLVKIMSDYEQEP